MGYYQDCAIPKPEPRCVSKRRKEKLDGRAERDARAAVRRRDKGKCRIPGCIDRGAHLHHIVYRSLSRGRRWDISNLVTLCVDHHRLVHAGIIRITGNADVEIFVEGDTDKLRFRL